MIQGRYKKESKVRRWIDGVMSLIFQRVYSFFLDFNHSIIKYAQTICTSNYPIVSNITLELFKRLKCSNIGYRYITIKSVVNFWMLYNWNVKVDSKSADMWTWFNMRACAPNTDENYWGEKNDGNKKSIHLMTASAVSMHLLFASTSASQDQTEHWVSKSSWIKWSPLVNAHLSVNPYPGLNEWPHPVTTGEPQKVADIFQMVSSSQILSWLHSLIGSIVFFLSDHLINTHTLLMRRI